MSHNLRVYTKALYWFDHTLRIVPDDAWSNPTPCPEWDVRDVVGHVIAVQRYIESLATGGAPPLDPYDAPGRHAGDDPVAAWAAVSDDLLAALDRPGVIGGVVRTFRGDEPLDRQLGWNVVDTLGHAWDIARGAGVDDRLEPSLVAHAAATAAPVIDAMRQPPFFAASEPAADGADAQERFLALLGRSSNG